MELIQILGNAKTLTDKVDVVLDLENNPVVILRKPEEYQSLWSIDARIELESAARTAKEQLQASINHFGERIKDIKSSQDCFVKQYQAIEHILTRKDYAIIGTWDNIVDYFNAQEAKLTNRGS